MNPLPPGTILQLMYLRERLKKLQPGHFIEVGPGSGEITSLLLELGWQGRSYDLEQKTIERLRARFTHATSAGKYTPIQQDYLTVISDDIKPVDLIISCMVMEHLNESLESKFMKKSRELLSPGKGMMIGLVPGSPNHWGIEDDIAGHCRRYTKEALQLLASKNSWALNHISGLTYPVSNVLLPISNYLVKKNESTKISLSNLEKTKASGIRSVNYKTHFPIALSIVLNRYFLLPLHWIQKAFRSNARSLVLYFEATPDQRGEESR